MVMKKNVLFFFISMFSLIFTLCISPKLSIYGNSFCYVNFHFDGLQAIAFGDSKRVSNGILDVHHHNPLIEIKEIKAGKETIIRTIKADELKGKVLNVDVPNTQLQPTRYYSPDMSKDSQDFRWCLDLESDLFQKQLYLREDKLFAKIHFQVGSFFATQLTEEKYKFVAGSTMHNFNRRIGRPGASIKLGYGQQLLIDGLDKPIVLPYINTVSYQISITNLPPKEMTSMDHFGFYYDVFKEPVKKFMPIEAKIVGYRPAPFLCEAVVLSKSSIN
jgi:hypothetical protein